ncbi:hypothetical protein RDI58_026794 [Solanum bulbocastanum]|uniref:Reverse transcriptase zinc-binding domain-containing protein n=1 Tax=Solanum bulbocastanum TaxID=147425 RepID=A0AAN8T0W0_SOLBU
MIIPRQAGQGELMMEFAKAQKGGKFPTKKMHTYIMPTFPREEWESITLQQGVHPRFKFILWLAVQKRLPTVERLEKFGIQVPSECVFCGKTKETFEHLYFDCQVTKTLWGRLCNWMGIQRSIHDGRTEIAWISEIAKKKAGDGLCVDKVLREIVMHIHLRGQHKASWKPILQALNKYP